MAADKLTGSCLCGAVHYEVSGEATRFYHCHCQRCRKASGSGHSSNLIVKPMTGLRWLKGEEYLQRFNVSETERFYTLFCKRCGSNMPREVPQLDAVIIAAGSLDEEPPIEPDGRIFWGSRSQWSCSDKDLPVYDEYPPDF